MPEPNGALDWPAGPALISIVTTGMTQLQDLQVYGTCRQLFDDAVLTGIADNLTQLRSLRLQQGAYGHGTPDYVHRVTLAGMQALLPTHANGRPLR
jgi:hypothetical protein